MSLTPACFSLLTQATTDTPNQAQSNPTPSQNKPIPKPNPTLTLAAKARHDSEQTPAAKARHVGAVLKCGYASSVRFGILRDFQPDGLLSPATPPSSPVAAGRAERISGNFRDFFSWLSVIAKNPSVNPRRPLFSHTVVSPFVCRLFCFLLKGIVMLRLFRNTRERVLVLFIHFFTLVLP